MSLKPEGCACWSQICETCGIQNYGCVRVDIYCGNCNGKLKGILYTTDVKIVYMDNYNDRIRK